MKSATGLGLVLALGVVSSSAQQIPPATSEDLEQRIKSLNVLPFEQLFSMEVTTVQRRESTVRESAAAISVITQEDIRRSGAQSIVELLRRVPGLNVARVGSYLWATSVRGFQDTFGNKLMVQIDGRTLYNPIFSSTFWDLVDYPLADIERIEVIRGPGASVWGANAVNGVINIITKSAAQTQGGRLSAGGGTEELGFGTFRYGGRAGSNATYRVYATSYRRDESFGRDRELDDTWWSARTGGRLDWAPGTASQLTLQGDYYHTEAGGITIRPQPTPPFQFPATGSPVSEGGDVLGRWTQTLANESSWTLQAYWDNNKRTTPQINIVRWDTYDVDFQHEFAWGTRQRVVWGAEYRGIDIRTETPQPFIITLRRRELWLDLFSAFVQDEIAIVPEKLTLLLGSKLEHNDFTGFEVQPTGRLLWTLTKQQTMWAALSRAVRTPSLLETEISATLLPVAPAPGTVVFPRVVPNPGFDSEELLAYELGYRIQPRPQLSVDAAVFYNDYADLRITVPQLPTTNGAPAGTLLAPVFQSNAMAGETYGLELATDWRVRNWWRLYGAYSLLQIQLHAAAALPAAAQASAEAVEQQSPQQQLYLQSSWDLPCQIELDLIGRYVDRLAGYRPAVGHYLSLDVRAGWRPRQHLLLEVVGQNLLDSQHQESAGPQQFVPVREIERGVYGKLTWWF